MESYIVVISKENQEIEKPLGKFTKFSINSTMTAHLMIMIQSQIWT